MYQDEESKDGQISLAVHTDIAEQFSKYLMPGEEILATISSEPVFETKHRLCVTNQRHLTLVKKPFFFGWNFFPLWLTQMRQLKFYLDEGIFRSSIVVLRNGKEIDRIKDVKKTDAREFLSLLEYAMNQNLELISEQRRPCPECREQVSVLAKKCRYCGHEF